ncbi:MAG: hypothetical protein HWD63_11980 [Candidatus Parvibacillus calidus]|nr:MAG: hypothetical protein HWD63_11980 [Candidatus Parvibacillus calidus]
MTKYEIAEQYAKSGWGISGIKLQSGFLKKNERMRASRTPMIPYSARINWADMNVNAALHGSTGNI